MSYNSYTFRSIGHNKGLANIHNVKKNHERFFIMNSRLQKKIRQWEKARSYQPLLPVANGPAAPGETDIPFEKLPVRAIGICKRNGFYTLRSLLDHYYTYETFQMFLGCGENTDKQLLAFCNNERANNYRLRCSRCQYLGILNVDDL